MLIPKTAYLLGPELEAGIHPHLALGVLVLVHPLLAVGRLVLGLLDDLQVVLGVVGELLPQQPLFALLLRLPRLATLGLLRRLHVLGPRPRLNDVAQARPEHVAPLVAADDGHHDLAAAQHREEHRDLGVEHVLLDPPALHAPLLDEPGDAALNVAHPLVGHGPPERSPLSARPEAAPGVRQQRGHRAPHPAPPPPPPPPSAQRPASNRRPLLMLSKPTKTPPTMSS